MIVKWLALLRGINVGGRNKIPMADLRALCADIGWRDITTYIQSGNVVFRAEAEPSALEAEPSALENEKATLENALAAGIAERFGLTVPVVVRSGASWHGYIAANPFPAESAAAPNRVMLAVAQAPPHTAAVDGLQAKAAAGEVVRPGGDALWIYFPDGVATSKLSPALLDRLVGSPVTMRNWRTVLALADLLV